MKREISRVTTCFVFQPETLLQEEKGSAINKYAKTPGKENQLTSMYGHLKNEACLFGDALSCSSIDWESSESVSPRL